MKDYKPLTDEEMAKTESLYYSSAYVPHLIEQARRANALKTAIEHLILRDYHQGIGMVEDALAAYRGETK